MANFYVTNNEYPQSPKLFSVSLFKVRGPGFEERDGFLLLAEPYWKITVYTSGKDAAGEDVGPVVKDNILLEEDIDTFIQEAVTELSILIDWTDEGVNSPVLDRSAPVIVEQHPKQGDVDVNLGTPVFLRVKDLAPGKGIDISTLVMTVNGYSVTPTVTGNKFDYTFLYTPIIGQ